MIYDLRRMIYLRCKYDIISVPSYAKHISSTAGGYHTKSISPVPTGTDIIEKTSFLRTRFFHGGTAQICLHFCQRQKLRFASIKLSAATVHRTVAFRWFKSVGHCFSKRKGHPFGCPFYLEVPPRFVCILPLAKL